MKNSTISIIIPVYNAAAWLRRCLDSIIGQTYPELEIILINDGSRDDSPAICRDYAARDRRLVVVDQPNGGSSSARNAGIERASGRYIMFVDADDWAEPELVAVLFSAIEAADCGWALCGCWQVTGFGPEAVSQVLRLGKEGVLPAIESLMGFARGDVKVMTTFASLWNKIYLVDIIREHAVRFGPTCPGTDVPVYPQEDFFFNLLYLAHIDRAVFVDQPLYHYQIHQTNENLVRRYRPHAFELHQQVYGAIRNAIWDRCSPDERRNFNRHYLDKTLIILAILCRNNAVFTTDALQGKIAAIVADPAVRAALEDFSAIGSQDSSLFDLVRRSDAGALYAWARNKGNEIYGMEVSLLH